MGGVVVYPPFPSSFHFPKEEEEEEDEEVRVEVKEGGD